MPNQPAQPPPENFRITDDHLGEGGAKTKFRNNLAAIYLLKLLESEGKPATPEEQAHLDECRREEIKLLEMKGGDK